MARIVQTPRRQLPGKLVLFSLAAAILPIVWNVVRQRAKKRK